ncbi:MAG: O-antigen ligase family protein [Solirubrobacteraceae bacterium]
MSVHAATAEHPLAAPGERLSPPERRAQVSASRQRGPLLAGTSAVAGLLCFTTFEAGGGLLLKPMTVVEIVLTLVSALVVAGAVLIAPRGMRIHGAWPTGLLLAFTALTALSVGWSVTPGSSWQDAGRMLSYSALFAAAVALARVCPRGWRALLGGVALSAVAVCMYALLTKVFPHQLDPHDTYARLQEPYGYWNSVGLTAALGAIACLWLGARRDGHGLISVLAYPAMGVLLVTLLLAYSRGALAALAIGVALWMAIVPLRLRGARVLIVGALGAAPVVAWAFSTHALSRESVGLAARVTAGRQLGVLLVAMVLVLIAAGVALGFSSARRPTSDRARARAGALLVASIVLALVGLAGALAVSKRGFTGTVSHDVRSLTDPNAPVPPNTPGRLTAIGSVRARYWKEALQAFDAHPVLGVGAMGYEVARLRYRKETLDVKHAHGYIVQTLSDLGVVGLALTLALLAVWLACAARATLPLDRRLAIGSTKTRLLGDRLALPRTVSWGRVYAQYTAERIGLLTMLCVVVAFGVHSFADWTWYVPGNACVALLCAGWLAGRGPLLARGGTQGQEQRQRQLAPEDTLVLPGARWRFLGDGQPKSRWRVPLGMARSMRADPRALLLAVGVIAFALVGAWTEWQPQRSVEASEESLALLTRSPAAARSAAQTAVDRDPLSAPALFTLAAVQRASGQAALGRSTLEKAVRLQPSNPQTWLELGLYDRGTRPRDALRELQAAVYLDPQSIPTQNAYVEALRATPPAAAPHPKVHQRRSAQRLRSARA